MSKLPFLPLGSPNFRSLRMNSQIYVDKTQTLIELAQSTQPLFLARPRRFGKSLLLSTFANLFRQEKNLFTGLTAEKYWQEKKYPVLLLDFSFCSNCRNKEEFLKKFRSMLLLADADIPVECSPDENPLFSFARYLHAQENNSLVLLIDEYDAPLSSILNDPNAFEDIRALLADFYLSIKSLQGNIRFLLITGILKFQNTSIFSAFNSLSDISLLPTYGKILGYTKEEIEKYFPEHLRYAAQVLAITEEDVLLHLEKVYDGYCFDSSGATRIFSPWSVLNFFHHPENGFKNYWWNSAGRSSLLFSTLPNYLQIQPEHFDQEKEIALEKLEGTARCAQDIELPSLLFHTGYLSIRKVIGNNALLGYPNEEVRYSMANLCAEKLWRNTEKRNDSSLHLVRYLKEGNLAGAVKSLNNAFLCADYSGHPFSNEAGVRLAMQMLLLGAELNPAIEVHNLHGRSDLEVRAGNFLWVFELKHVKEAKAAPQALQRALQQLQERHYGHPSIDSQQLRCALVFAEDRKEFVLSALAPSIETAI